MLLFLFQFFKYNMQICNFLSEFTTFLLKKNNQKEKNGVVFLGAHIFFELCLRQSH